MPDGQLVAVAVCPHPPMLIPEIASGASGELEDLRTACDETVRRLLAADPDRVVIVGAAPRAARNVVLDHVGFGRYTAGAATTGVPLPLAVGAWLLWRAGTRKATRGWTVAADTPPRACLAVGAEVTAEPGRTGLLVMGDGSARRTEKAPGHFHPRAEAYDATVATALGAADLDVLARLDPTEAAELMVAGRVGWQVLAGAASGRRFTADLLYDAAPYGVGYLVASWT